MPAMLAPPVPAPIPVAELLDAATRRAGSVELRGDPAAAVLGITHDSRLVRPGWLFLAMAGTRTDGHRFAADALHAGASAFAVEHFVDLPVTQLRVPSVQEVAGPLAAALYGHPSQSLSVVGVTGTNGKTTTCELLRGCFESVGAPAGQIGTVGTHIGTTFLPASLTTPEASELQGILASMHDVGVRHVAMEVSSHGLDRHRVDGTRFELAVFLNLTPEHLEYHGTMERYFAAKAKLFEPHRADRGLVCVDGVWGRRLARAADIPVLTFGSSSSADVTVACEGFGLEGIRVRLEGIDDGVELRSPLVGVVNAPNVAAAYLAARLLGIGADEAAAAIGRCPAPPGRFEVVSGEAPFLAAVDYAHTPDALEALLATASTLTHGKGRVTLVLGARGGRYRAKRSAMGAIGARGARVVLTTDSPGDEDPRAIIAHLAEGTRGVPDADVVVEPDRRRAIELAVGRAGDGDVILVTGRGHETTQRFGTLKVDLDDRSVARSAVAARHTARDGGDGRVGDPAASRSPRDDERDQAVTVVIPAHDAEATLARAMTSVLRQLRPPDELIVVDDGSTDGTGSIAVSIAVSGAGTASGVRTVVRVLTQACGGPSAARNAGLEAASGHLVAFLDADDEWHPAKLELQLACLERHPDAVIVASDWFRTLAAGSDPGPNGPGALGEHAGGALPESFWTTRDILLLNRFQTSTVLIDREVALRAGGFDPAVDGAEDWDLWLRASRFGSVVKLDVPLVAYTDRPEGYSKDLRRHYDAASSLVRREVGAERAAPDGQRDLDVVLAWHHLRYAVAFGLLGERRAALGCLAALQRDRVLRQVPAAATRHLAPFLAARVRRRLPLGRDAKR